LPLIENNIIYYFVHQEYGFLGLACLQLCGIGLVMNQEKEKGSLEPTEVVTDRVFSIMGENNVGGVSLTCTLTFYFFCL
jgi:hypothetical protein